MNRPAESKKNAAMELAHLIAHESKDKGKIISLQRQLALPGIDSNMQDTDPDAWKNQSPLQEGRVGIWKSKKIEGKEFFARDKRFQREFELWADIPMIPPKSDKRRIVLIGESVARGFLYDPKFTPASLLESMLNASANDSQYEVVDLAKTDLHIDELAELSTCCFALLNPDLVIIFAGNNWNRKDFLSSDTIDILGDSGKSQEGSVNIKSILEQYFDRMIETFTAHIYRYAAYFKVPVIYIIPEFNLLDWNSSQMERLFMKVNNNREEWFRVKEEVKQALSNNEVDKALSLTGKMIKLNELNPLGYELHARCKLEKGLVKEAKKYFKLARDSAMYRMLYPPAIISMFQDILRNEAYRHGIDVIDLPQIFEEHLQGGIPDRRLFLDYCHMTFAGIQVSMAAVAKKILSLFEKEENPLEVLIERGKRPDNDTMGTAHFFAAVHNFRRGEQPFDILYYHCVMSMQFSEVAKDLMLKYISLATRRIPWLLNKAYEEFLTTGLMDQFHLMYHPDPNYTMDIELVKAMIEALKTIGIDIKEQTDRLRIKEHGFINGKINLLESYYKYNCPLNHIPDNDYYHYAFDKKSYFYLICEKDLQITLNLTARIIRKEPAEAKISISINDYIIDELNMSGKWDNYSLKIPPQVLTSDGINKIIIEWPITEKEHIYRKGRSIRDLIIEKFFPIYGEIHMFEAIL